MKDVVRYLSAEKREFDDFEDMISKKVGDHVYDAKTKYGPWATMTQKSFEKHGLGLLGTGWGQKYQRNEAGQLVKVEG